MSVAMEQCDPQVDVSIVLPCLNEVKSLAPCIRAAMEALDELLRLHGLSGEVLLADNGSTDGSQALALRLCARVVAVPERGYGAALRGGFLSARGRFLVMGDADGSYDFREAVGMVEQLLAGADLCMGSRFKGRILPNAMPWKNRYIGNPVLTTVLNLLFRTRVSDAHCGLRALTADCFERRSDIRHPVADVVNALAPAGQELPDRGVAPGRLQQLDPGGAAGPCAHAEHGLPHSLVLVQLPAGHSEVEDGLISGDRGLKVVTGDPHVVDLVQHRRLPRLPAASGVLGSPGRRGKCHLGNPSVSWQTCRPHRTGAGKQRRKPCQKR